MSGTMKRIFKRDGSSSRSDVGKKDNKNPEDKNKTQAPTSSSSSRPSSSTEATTPSSSSSSLLPLSGARVYIITDDFVKQREMSAFIRGLGGTTPHIENDATHALWAATKALSSGGDSNHRDLTISKELQQTLLKFQKHNIPVVEVSWLERLAGLQDGENWSSISVDPYLSPIFAMITILGDDNADSMDIDEDGDHRMGGVGVGVGVETVDDEEELTAATQDESIDYTLETVVEASATDNVIEVGLRWRRDNAAALGKSIAQTFAALTREEPDKMEKEAIRRAMELSLLDCALVYRKPDDPGGFFSTFKTTMAAKPKPIEQTPHEILGVVSTATPKQIKAAYRKLALVHHPDKGGSADKFESIARAYRSILSPDSNEPQREVKIKNTSHWDNELQDHRRLVQDLFQAHGSNIDEFVSKQVQVLETVNLVAKDAGATNVNERDELIHNSCFYLSLAASYLGGIGALGSDDGDEQEVTIDGGIEEESADRALIGETALQLKRIIEAAVVKAHPEWAAQGMVGEEVQAFSDFLVYTLDSSTLLSDWAVVVFDTTSGFCDVYKGQQYAETAAQNPDWARSNTITLRYIPGHYQPLVNSDKNAQRPTLEEILQTLDKAGVFYVVTDGAA